MVAISTSKKVPQPVLASFGRNRHRLAGSLLRWLVVEAVVLVDEAMQPVWLVLVVVAVLITVHGFVLVT